MSEPIAIGYDPNRTNNRPELAAGETHTCVIEDIEVRTSSSGTLWGQTVLHNDDGDFVGNAPMWFSPNSIYRFWAFAKNLGLEQEIEEKLHKDRFGGDVGAFEEALQDFCREHVVGETVDVVCSWARDKQGEYTMDDRGNYRKNYDFYAEGQAPVQREMPE